MVGIETSTIFRYDAPARRRALLLLLASLAAAVLALAMLVTRWSLWGFTTRSVAILLVLAALFAVRAQFARLRFKLILNTESVTVALPWGARTVPWTRIVEVQRINKPEVGRSRRRWACTIWTVEQAGRPHPLYLFDNQMEHAPAALDLIDEHTPDARHTGRPPSETSR